MESVLTTVEREIAESRNNNLDTDALMAGEEEEEDEGEDETEAAPATLVATTQQQQQLYDDTKPLTYQKYSFYRSAQRHFEYKEKSMAVLRCMMIGALNDEVNSFEQSPFSELSIPERQSFQLQRAGLVEEVIRRAYFLYYVDEKDPKRIFPCTRNQFPKPGMWSMERCIEWLNHPIRQLATQDELLWMRQEYQSFLVLSTARVTSLRQEREAAFSASQQAAAKLLGNKAGAATLSFADTRYYDADGDDNDNTADFDETRPMKRRRGRPSREESALLQVLQSNNSVCLALEKAVVGIHQQNTLLINTICVQTELATLQSRENVLTALLIAREKTRDRRVELKAAGKETISQTLVDDAVADCDTTRKELQALQDEIKALKDQVHEKMGKKPRSSHVPAVPPVDGN